jgi:Flp pilus assembly protein TadG
MRGISSWRNRNNEEGAVAVIVAVSMAALLGIAALVIDVGAVRQERRELQNGADAAALALAQECALGLCAGLQAKATTYANLNAADGASAVTEAVELAGGQVRVRTQTLTSGGSGSLLMQFAPVVGGPSSSTVTATATASWFAPLGAQTVPLTISRCEFNELTVGNTTFGTSKTILFHDPDPQGNQTGPGSCSLNPAGQNLPGGFGWLDTISNSICATNVTGGGWYGSAPGNAPPNQNNSGCSPSNFLNTDLLIPVYNDFSGSGQGGQYLIYGLATFRITSMRLGGNGSAWTTSPAPAGCSSSQRCIQGYFVRKIIPWSGGPIGGGAPNLGTLSVRLVS